MHSISLCPNLAVKQRIVHGDSERGKTTLPTYLCIFDQILSIGESIIVIHPSVKKKVILTNLKVLNEPESTYNHKISTSSS